MFVIICLQITNYGRCASKYLRPSYSYTHVDKLLVSGCVDEAVIWFVKD